MAAATARQKANGCQNEEQTIHVVFPRAETGTALGHLGPEVPVTWWIADPQQELGTRHVSLTCESSTFDRRQIREN
ncbi:hypothetical protein GCM10023155_26720 [Bremerella cremea]